MRWPFFIIGIVFLLVGSYLDNVRGPLIPALIQQASFNYQSASQILIGGHLTAFVVTWLLIPGLNRVSIRFASILASFLGILICGFSLVSRGTSEIILWGATVGGVVSLCGTLSNLFTQRSSSPIHRTRAMAASHAAYGLASFAAPMIAAPVLVDAQAWPQLFVWAIPAFAVLILLCLWLAPESKATAPQETLQSIGLSKEQWLVVAVVILYVGGEVLASMWMTSWVVSAGASLQVGARYTAIFFALMTATRLICAIFLPQRWIPLVLWLSLLVPIVCFVTGRIFDVPLLVSCTGLLGPFFPLFLSRASVKFPGKDRTLTIWILSLMQILLALVHLVVGEIAGKFGMSLAYWLPPVFLAMSALLMTRVNLFGRAASEHSRS